MTTDLGVTVTYTWVCFVKVKSTEEFCHKVMKVFRQMNQCSKKPVQSEDIATKPVPQHHHVSAYKGVLRVYEPIVALWEGRKLSLLLAANNFVKDSL